ncbi:MAG: TonB-dependent receptor [Pseudomonadota bacterium]|nr:TonB-dependent receptor [Pseudomonadota bacterium]
MQASVLSRPLVAIILCSTQTLLAYAKDGAELFDLDLETLLTIQVGTSADASAKGLSTLYAGDQVANGGRLGILGTKEIMDAPFSTTSYTQEFTQNHQAASIGEVLQYDPSVQLARGFGNFQQVYRVRGLPIFSDDMTYNGLYGILPRQYLAAELIERVEVLRGANAFINGAPPGVSGSLGGGIGAVPKRAPKQDLTRITLGAQSDSQSYAAADIARRTNDSRFGIRMNGVDRRGDAATDGESRALQLVTLGTDFRSNDLRISADFGYQDQQLDASPSSVTIGSGLPIPDAPDASHNIGQPWSYSDAQDLFGTLRAEYDFTPQLTGWLAVGAREGEEDSIFSAFLTTTNTAGDFSASRFDVIHDDSVTTGELGLRAGFHTGTAQHQLTLSANAYENDSRNAYLVYNGFTNNLYQPTPVARPETPVFAGGDLARPLITNTTKTASLALADELTLLDERLLLTLGARQQNIREYNFDYNTGAAQSAYDENQLTPAFAALYKFSPRYSAYINYMEGLLKGDIAPTTNADGPVANGGEALAPYQTQQTELGIKYAGKSLGAALALFEIRKPLAGYNSMNALALVDDQIHRGLELSLYGEAAPGLKLLGGISLLDSDERGQDTIGAPNIQSNLGLEWDLPGINGLSLNSHWMYTGNQYADLANSQKVPSWQRLDLGARYAMKMATQTLTIRANLENATGSDYWASVGGFPGAGYLTQGNPRTLVVSAAIDF